ncbi:MAG TPA: response regulator [Gemmataceae bacterium]|nr:response regulator [Gemmataceae bacterium]
MPKLLYVDDEPDNIDLLTRRLARRGFEVKGAAPGPEGLTAAAAWKPDLILMDIKMPVMDGYEATTRLKADPATKAIPVIALTAHAMREDEERAKAAGADDYATKPVDLPALLEKIGKLIPPGG